MFGGYILLLYIYAYYSDQMMGNHVELISKHTTTILYTTLRRIQKTQYSQSH